MKTKTVRALMSIGAALALVNTHAETISFAFTNPLAATEISQTGALGLFDNSLGTLTAASITVDASAQFQFSGTNVSPQAQTAIITSETNIGIGSTIPAMHALFNHDTYSDFLLSATSGPQSYAPGQTRPFGPIADQGVVTKDLSTLLGALSVPGGGNFTLNCDSLSGITVQGGGGQIATTQSTQARCGATITYTYTPSTPVRLQNFSIQ